MPRKQKSEKDQFIVDLIQRYTYAQFHGHSQDYIDGCRDTMNRVIVDLQQFYLKGISKPVQRDKKFRKII